MKKNYIFLIVTSLTLLYTGCSKDAMSLFEGYVPSMEKRFDKSMYYNEEHGYPVLKVKDDNYRIYVCTDTHVKDSTTTLRKFIQLYHDDKDCPAAVHLGDLIESDETYRTFVQALDETSASPSKHDTMFVTIGNHDIFYKQWYDYTYFWPNSTYYFIIESQGKTKAKDLYICLDSAQGKIGFLQMKWLRDLLQTWYGSFRHVVVFSHVNIFRRENTSADISTTALEETYELMWLFTTYGVEQFWAGHDHSREEFTEGGVKYIIVDSMQDGNPEAAYMILHVGSQLNNTFHFINESDEEE